MDLVAGRAIRSRNCLAEPRRRCNHPWLAWLDPARQRRRTSVQDWRRQRRGRQPMTVPSVRAGCRQPRSVGPSPGACSTRRGIAAPGAGGAGLAALLAACGTKGTRARPTPRRRPRRTARTPRRWSTGPTGRSTSTSTTRRHDRTRRSTQFTEKTGIKVTYTEDVQRQRRVLRQDPAAADRRPGHRPRRLVVTDWMVAKLIRLGWVQKLDQANIPNAKNLRAHPGRRRVRPGPQVLAALAVRLRRHRATTRKATGGKKIEIDGPAAHRPGAARARSPC